MTAMTYITTHTVNYKFCKMASDSNIKTDEIKSIIESIMLLMKWHLMNRFMYHKIIRVGLIPYSFIFSKTSIL